MRCVIRWTIGSSVHVLLSHHVVHEVRISEVNGMNSSSFRPPLAVEVDLDRLDLRLDF